MQVFARDARVGDRILTLHAIDGSFARTVVSVELGRFVTSPASVTIGLSPRRVDVNLEPADPTAVELVTVPLRAPLTVIERDDRAGHLETVLAAEAATQLELERGQFA